MNVQINDKNGIILNTNGTYNNENIGVIPNLQNKTVTQNGIVQADTGYCGLDQVTVNVAGSTATYCFLQNGTFTFPTTWVLNANFDNEFTVGITRLYNSGVTVEKYSNGVYESIIDPSEVIAALRSVLSISQGSVISMNIPPLNSIPYLRIFVPSGLQNVAGFVTIASETESTNKIGFIFNFDFTLAGVPYAWISYQD